jgi:hypothetical protein
MLRGSSRDESSKENGRCGYFQSKWWFSATREPKYTTSWALPESLGD